jgi:hypothetical protein
VPNIRRWSRLSRRETTAGTREERRDDDAESGPELSGFSLEPLQEGRRQLELDLEPWHKNGTVACVRPSSPSFGNLP